MLQINPPPKPDAPLDHEAIKRYFAAKDVGLYNNTPFEIELKETHAANRFARFVFGRAQWTYVPLEVAVQVEKVIDKHKPPEIVPQRATTYSYVYYIFAPDERLWYLPPRSGHQNFLDWFEAEWPYATDEQRTLGVSMLEQMEKDSVTVPTSLLTLAKEWSNGTTTIA
jgi:hypothetical protein